MLLSEEWIEAPDRPLRNHSVSWSVALAHPGGRWQGAEAIWIEVFMRRHLLLSEGILSWQPVVGVGTFDSKLDLRRRIGKQVEYILEEMKTMLQRLEAPAVT